MTDLFMTEQSPEIIELPENDLIAESLPHLDPKQESGHWEVHNPERPTLMPSSWIKVGQVAVALTDKYNDGWRFWAIERRAKDNYGHVIYFVPDVPEVNK